MSFTLSPQRRIFQVSELNRAVQQAFESEFRCIWVAGEISGCRPAASGHVYFSLKDQQSQIKCALFKGAARFVKFRPQDGTAVLARGNLEVYEARGEYQLIVELLEPQGAGGLQIAFEQLKKKLASEGLFEQARKRELPKLPWRIGIVTSPDGAAVRDILHVLERRFPGLHVRLFPAQVQGENSAAQLCAGLQHFSESGWAEVVILTRGGGSLEDLWSFNEEAVVRAIASSKVPIVSAVGHETDFTMADFVADLRAPTPSAAAEIIVPTRGGLLEQVAAWRARAAQGMRYRLLLCRRSLHERGTDRAAALMQKIIVRRAQRLDDLEARLQANNLRLRFARTRHRQESLSETLRKHMQANLWEARRRHEVLDMHLRQLSPLTVLARGYAIVANPSGRVLRSSSESEPGEALKVRLHEGELDVTVEGTRPAPNRE